MVYSINNYQQQKGMLHTAIEDHAQRKESNRFARFGIPKVI